MALGEYVPTHRLVLSRNVSRTTTEEGAMEVMTEAVRREADSYSEENRLEAAIRLAGVAGEAIAAAGERSDIEETLKSHSDLLTSAAINGLSMLVNEFRMSEAAAAAKQ